MHLTCLSCMPNAPLPHPPWFVTLIILGKEYKSWSSSLCNFQQPPVTLSILSTNIFLSIMFSKTVSLCPLFLQQTLPMGCTGLVQLISYSIKYRNITNTNLITSTRPATWSMWNIFIQSSYTILPSNLKYQHSTTWTWTMGITLASFDLAL